ncbi:MAG: SusC/RagA family TonB-linked outer membrane protein [Cyclobacteriaceae bacterium]
MKNATNCLPPQWRSALRPWCFSVFFLAVSMGAWAQDRSVSGTVSDTESGEALPGVNVILKGTTEGTVTDIQGAYRLSVPENGGTLVFSFIGLTSKEVEIGDQSTIDVMLEEDARQLSEVVVTALGIEKSKNELSYAAQKVEGEELSQTRTNNFVNNLSGRVAGLNIRNGNSLGGSTNAVIRGSTSLTGNNQALFVIDGLPVDNSNNNTGGGDDPNVNQQEGRGGFDYGNAAADINPDNIESVTVLKGAAATVLYGARAANGVIVITTKKGARDSGIGVTINTGVTLGFVDKSTFAEYQDEYGAGYGPYYGEDNPFFYENDVNGDGVVDLVVPVTEDASFGAAFDPSLQVYPWSAFDPGSPNYLQSRPWVAAGNGPSEFFKTAVSVNNSVAIDGGSDKGAFRLGYTRNVDKGVLPNSEIVKNLINFSASYDIVENLTASASINFSDIEGLGRYGTGYDSRNIMTNYRQWWQTNVDVLEQKEAYFRTGQNATWNQSGVGAAFSPIFWDNPYWTRYENYQNDDRSRYFGYIDLNYKINDWLSASGKISLDSYDELQEERIAVGSIDVSDYTRFNRSFRENNYQLLLNINKELSDDFSLTGLIGGNLRRTSIESIRARTNGGLLIPGLYALKNTANPLEAPFERVTTEQVNGIFADVTVGYREFVFLEVAGRRDQSSTLPTGNNAYFYPSISTSFVFSELVGDSPVLTYGKIRANYAEVGNAAPPLYILDYYDVPTGINGTPLASVDNTKFNQNLRPERTKSYEIGIETSYLDGRVGFDITYYKQNSEDQIVPLPISRATGYDFKILNAGEIENKGFELSAFVTPVRNDVFSWTLNANWSRNRNRVVQLAETDNLQLGSFQGGVTINAALGEPYGTIRGDDYVRDEDTGQRLIGEDGQYLTSGTSNEIIGDVNPDWVGGVSNTVKFKNLSLSFLIDVKKGGDVFSLDQYYGLATGLYPETAGLNDLGNPIRASVETNEDGVVIDNPDNGGIILDGILEDGTPNQQRIPVEYGTLGYVNRPAAAFVYDASYVKLREATITYSLPQSVLDNIQFLQGIDVSLIGRNLWIIHKNMPYADPEEGLSSGNIQGYQVGAYPTTRNVGFNVKIRF